MIASPVLSEKYHGAERGVAVRCFSDFTQAWLWRAICFSAALAEAGPRCDIAMS